MTRLRCLLNLHRWGPSSYNVSMSPFRMRISLLSRRSTSCPGDVTRDLWHQPRGLPELIVTKEHQNSRARAPAWA